MKKLITLIALVFTTLGYSQAEFEKIALTENTASSSTNRINTQEANGEVNYINALNLPVSTATTNALELKTTLSAGAFSGFEVTNNGDGTISVGSGIAYLRATNDQYAPLIKYPIAAYNNIPLVDNLNNYIVVSYNGGSPALVLNTTGTGIDTQTTSIAIAAARVGTTVHYVSLVGSNSDPNAKLRNRYLLSEGIRRVSGLAISATGRKIATTAGITFSGLIRLDVAGMNTNASDTYTLAYNNGSTWTRVAGQTDINNTQYNNAGTLTALNNNSFRTDYIYALVNSPSKLFVILGNTQYNTIGTARLAPTPSSLPVELEQLGVLVGRAIIEKDAVTMEMASPFVQDFAAGAIENHNDLAGLQGGTAGEYNHLTNAQVSLVNGSEQAANKATDFTTINNTLYPTVKAVNDAISIKNYALTENPASEINTATWDGFPMLFQSKTGKLILIHKSGVAHGGAASSGIRTSLDGGKTYSAYTPLVNEPTKYNGISGGCVTPTGRIVLFYFIATPGVGTDEIGYFYSDDDAITWSSRITIPMGSNVGGGWTGKSIEIADGKLMQVWWGADGSLTLPATVHTLYAVFSTDNGSTWGNQTVITTGTTGTNDPYTEASFVYLEGNAIVGLVRKNGKDFYTQFKSEDNGVTWTNQGDETFENFNGNPGAPELQTYIDLDGKKTVICYFSNRIDLNVKSILGRNLLSGVSGWIESTETILRSGLTNYDSGYPSAIHPNGSRFGLVAYYESKNLTDDADIQFVISRPDSEIILPNSFLTVIGQVKAGSFRGANLTDTYFPKATTSGQLINSTQLTENTTTLNVNNPGNTFSKFSIRDGTDLGVYFKAGQTDPTAMMLNFVNDALTANIPAEFRASSFNFTNGGITAVSYTGGATLTGTPTAPTPTAGDNSTKIATTAYVDSAVSAAAEPYLVYTALISQSGTSAPTATVLRNTLSGTVVWTRSSSGQYLGTLAGVFTTNKTATIVGATSVSYMFALKPNSVDNVALHTALESTGAFGDDKLVNTFVEIRVYP